MSLARHEVKIELLRVIWLAVVAAIKIKGPHDGQGGAKSDKLAEASGEGRGADGKIPSTRARNPTGTLPRRDGDDGLPE